MSQTPTVQETLSIHEWLAVVILAAILFLFALFTRFSSESSWPPATEGPHHIVDQKIELFVEGAVERPGRLITVKGKRVKEILEEVRPLPEADLSKLKLESKVRRGQHIRVPLKKRKNSSIPKDNSLGISDKN